MNAAANSNMLVQASNQNSPVHHAQGLPLTVSNAEFLQAIFGRDYERAHVTAFKDSPDAIAEDARGRCWAGGPFQRLARRINAGQNAYMTISLFRPDVEGKAKRQKVLFERAGCIVVDDVGTKVIDTARLPPPSWRLETSPGNEQWGYILQDPNASQERVSGLLSAMVANGLCPDGKDPGMKGVTRYVRLPEGSNLKSTLLAKLGPAGWRCRLQEWQPERKFTVNELMRPFGITEADLIAHSDQSHSSAPSLVTSSDDPVLRVISDAGMYKGPAGPGWHNVTCPNLDEHTSQDDSGSAVFVGADGTYGYQCHHGHCEGMRFSTFVDLFDQETGGTAMRDTLWAEQLRSAAEDFAEPLPGDAADVVMPAAPKRHPLAMFLDCDLLPRAPKLVIPGFIGHGVTVIAGAHGAGKTTTILPLSMVAAGLHAADDPLAPLHWRHVVYIVEDADQAQRILSGIVAFGGLGLDKALVRERLHLVAARRLDPTYVAQVGPIYSSLFTRTVAGVDILPLVVIDTKAAVLDLENENDNAEASKAMAALKQGFADLPVWLIGHVAKQNVGRAELGGLSMRGGSAFEADANQTLFLVKEADGSRYLLNGKTRFEPRWPELRIEAHSAEVMAPNEFGVEEEVTMRWGIARPPEQTRRAVKEQALALTRSQEAEELYGEIRGLVGDAWDAGMPMNREAVKGNTSRNRSAVIGAIETLLAECWLFEVPVPAKERTHPKRSAYLVAFTSDERDAFMADGRVPETLLQIPPTWRKASVPATSALSAKSAGANP